MCVCLVLFLSFICRFVFCFLSFFFALLRLLLSCCYTSVTIVVVGGGAAAADDDTTTAADTSTVFNNLATQLVRIIFNCDNSASKSSINNSRKETRPTHEEAAKMWQLFLDALVRRRISSLL